jgi:hypothetical protein
MGLALGLGETHVGTNDMTVEQQVQGARARRPWVRAT